MTAKIETFLGKYEALILLLLLAAILLVYSHGLAWGLPALWNPDELAAVVITSLDGPVDFNQTNFDYPSLPKYVILFAGRVTDALGYPRTTYFLVARFISVFLSAMTAWLAYALVRQVGGRHLNALLAALLVSASSELALNAHFAHNDLYVTFFTGMTVFLGMKYVNTTHKSWLYAAFFTAGLAASSKYNGGAVILAVLLAYLLVEGKQAWLQKIRTFETIFVGAGLSILAFGLGTPTSLTSFAFYIKRLLPALWRHANYNRTPSTLPGIFRQWEVMASTFGGITFILFLVSFTALLAIGIFYLLRRIKLDDRRVKTIALVFVALIGLDLPILVSYNLHQRFFLPFLPLIAVLIMTAFEEFQNWLQRKGRHKASTLAAAGIVLLIALTGLRVFSVVLSIRQDARIPAAKFISNLPAEADYEVTMYGPNFNEAEFLNLRTYPLVFLKFPDQSPPKDPYLEYNTGEKGIEERTPDYFIISSFIYNRFTNDYICSLHQADCDFFRKLLTGETNYQEMAHFAYHLPRFLPDIRPDFVNPEIRIYQRFSEIKVSSQPNDDIRGAIDE